MPVVKLEDGSFIGAFTVGDLQVVAGANGWLNIEGPSGTATIRIAPQHREAFLSAVARLSGRMLSPLPTDPARKDPAP